MEEQINEQNLIEQLRAAFPELEGSYDERVAFWGREQSPSNYDVLGFVFRPRLIEEIEKGEVTDFLRRSAAFMERVCTSGNVEAVNVVWTKVFEWLIFRRKELELCWPLFGPATKAAIKDAARRWSDAGRRFGRIEELPEKNFPTE
jgi:hypothetical protein